MPKEIRFSKIKVLLIHSPFKNLKFGREWEPTESLAPPPSMMYLATPLIKKGYDISFVDLNVDRLEEEEFLDLLKDKDFVLLSCYSQSLKNVEKLIQHARNVNEKAFIMCGGPYCYLTQNYVEGSDMTVVGEAEEIIAEILERQIRGRSFSNIPGLIYKKDEKIIQNPGILEVKDLDKTAPSWELARNKNYGYFLGCKFEGIAGVISSRGCPFRCTYCTTKGIIKYRERSVENVIDELKDLKKRGIKYVVFYDDNFLMNKQRVVKLMDRINEERLKFKIIVEGRVDSANYDLYKKLRKGGVICIMFGIENANQDVLDFYNKQITVSKTREAIELANKLGIITLGYFMIGSPLEDEAHLKVNEKFLSSVPLDILGLFILGYYQGSKLWDDAVKKDLIKKNETIVYANEKLSHYSYQEWLNLKEKLIKNFYVPSRMIHLFYKCMRLGLLSVILKVLWHSRNDFFERVKSPFVTMSKDCTRIIVDKIDR